jgi:hypothetical protein
VTQLELLQLDRQLDQQGYRDRPGLLPSTPNPQVKGYAAPVLQYATNINGGNPPGDLVLGSLVFSGDKSLSRKSGIVVGVAVGGGARLAIGEARILEISARASQAHSPQHGIGTSTLSLGGCSSNHVAAWWYVDLCADTQHVKRDLLTDAESTISLSVSRLFSQEMVRHHEVEVSARRLFADSHDQSQLAVSWKAAHPDGTYTSLSAVAGEQVPGHLALRWSASATLGTRVAGRPISIWGAYSVKDGQRMLSFERRDQTRSIGATLGVTHHLSISAAYSWTRSSIPYFSNQEPSLALQLTPITF